MRGIKLKNADDEVISMSILKHLDITPDERDAYLKAANREVDVDDVDASDATSDVELSPERFQEMLSKEQILLTMSNKGYGKRTSAYEYRVSGRGGQGVTNMNLTDKNGGAVVASFPVTDSHQVMQVTNQGKLIRTPVENIRITSRSTQGVTVFKVDKNEEVVSVAWLISEDDDDETDEALEGAALNEDGTPVEAVAPEDAAVASEGAPSADESEASPESSDE